MGRGLVRLALADFDVIAVHAVVADLERRDARRRFFALFQIDEKLIGIRRKQAQLVEFGIETGTDDSAVAHQRGWLIDDRVPQIVGRSGMLAEAIEKFAQQRAVARFDGSAQGRRGEQPIAQGRQVARPRRTQRHARKDTFQIANAA